ncbi:F-box/LRR-repeat protein 20-like [Sphaerodactylus townsendi]|uniref:F-box/LRR-repeat protein 20-like n=1 Tax=Sphaerodactylus townsendi TaxID=933632 RepID=UPI002026FF2F|nr:F-box/LRR-repeat protein 20-like [Sphaerodactylus townsendi]
MKCPNMKVLNIGRIHKVTADCLAQVVNNMKKLICLDITGLNMVKDCVVRFIAMKCPELECLVLNSCSQVTDLSLIEISTYLPTIRYLDVSGCKGVTDTGVQALAGSCWKLFHLDLSSTAISKRGVCLLASFCFRTLECVKISFCKAITSDAVAKLCKNCKRLKILHLYGCSFMPDLESIKKINKNVEVFHDLPIPAAKLSSE